MTKGEFTAFIAFTVRIFDGTLTRVHENWTGEIHAFSRPGVHAFLANSSYGQIMIRQSDL